MITIEDSDDSDLVAAPPLRGVVRAAKSGKNGSSTDLLIELERDTAYHGRFDSDAIWWLVATPCTDQRRTDNLLLASVIVRFSDALSFEGATRNRTIGIGRVRLE